MYRHEYGWKPCPVCLPSFIEVTVLIVLLMSRVFNKVLYTVELRIKNQAMRNCVSVSGLILQSGLMTTGRDSGITLTIERPTHCDCLILVSYV